ncbi:DDE-type integrase/transposase/recombinase [Bradyrhizobium lablabi]|uniref:DDE-type integrase/transposase/recombinase n=1 Tax=Bradyrhizobium lablabi TaxID=722472 RepID=UPI001BA5FD37|nr:DDE-type integrase/transposase/recombinase [Bradyrhizobium lablabi]MBR0695332.1 DDE-type integrase/transposase/recombinase [Bradyrhizobium lablabi]
MSAILNAHLVERVLIRELSDGERLLRVVRNDGLFGYVWLFDVFKKHWPFPVEHATIITGPNELEPKYRLEHEDPWPPSIYNFGDTTATDDAQAKRWKLVNLLIGNDDGHDLLFKKLRKARFDSVMKAENVPRSTLENLIMRYWQRGMKEDALRPDFARCGGRGKLRNSKGAAKIGRPRSISDGTGASVDEEKRAHLTIAADYYLTSKKISQKGALDHIVRLFYKNPEARGGDDHPLRDDRPTERQLRYFLQTNYSHSHRFRARNGQKKFELTARGLGGSGEQNTHGPGDMFQVDATVADVYLVSKLDRNRIVGRPTVYFVIDVWSRLITGLYVGFEGPSWIGAMMALVNMVTPKVEFCAQYEIEIDEDEWPSHHAPRTILADKGELASCDLGQRIVDTLNIQIGNAASGRADLKAIVERRFGIVPTIFSPFIPGYVEKDFGQRGVRDYRLDAKLTLREFTKFMIRAVLEHNGEAVTEIKTPAPMTTAGMGPVPLERWKWGIENRSGKLRRLEVDHVALNVMPRDRARVTEKGIRFRGGFYTCATARREEWFSRARIKGTWSEIICFDPRSLDKMYLLNRTLPGGFETCELMKVSEELIETSLAEYQEVSHEAKVVKAKGEEKRQARRIRIDEQMQEIASTAARETLAVRDPDVSASKRVAEISENKKAEKALQRRSEVFDLSPTLTSPAIVPDPDQDTVDEDTEDYAMKFLSHLSPVRKDNDRGT